ncbi:hypothetical protein EVAR_57619_1 [Eumeta japonica]|uniref:Uncharacterized protein n=1 Tax=Eumeta variegata TaxID=151549 RepID=A0A4C1XYQ2_EUMVA|nr:hypothetical protein EVAR_57619_1 [Eumeta japonica]
MEQENFAGYEITPASVILPIYHSTFSRRRPPRAGRRAEGIVRVPAAQNITRRIDKPPKNRYFRKILNIKDAFGCSRVRRFSTTERQQYRPSAAPDPHSIRSPPHQVEQFTVSQNPTLITDSLLSLAMSRTRSSSTSLWDQDRNDDRDRHRRSVRNRLIMHKKLRHYARFRRKSTAQPSGIISSESKSKADSKCTREAPRTKI